MDYDATTRLWTVTTSLLDKEFKFRSNNNWDSDNYGAVSGKESELEGELVAGPNNFKVLKASPYVITMNLTNAGKYSYSMVETTIELSSAEMALPGAIRDGTLLKMIVTKCNLLPATLSIPEHFILMPIPNLNSGMPGYGSV